MVQMQTTLRDSIQMIEDDISAGQLNEAMASCQQLLVRYPDALDIQRLLGEVYMAQGRLEEAQQAFDWILVNDPENVIVYCDRALLCQHLQDFDTALDCYQQAYELSRGNSQIRRGFNQLSAQVGQQEFMLSRAGLARLYMRGDLLTQAIQEWEAVLAVTPDRLDARLGLLETYWRDGSFDKVERLAQQILEEFSGCLKALLLLAHVTSAFNMQRARELLQRAAAFDPELMMAQELFSDLVASQPHDPFLALIKQGPVSLSDQESANGKSIELLSTAQYAAMNAQKSSHTDSQVLADRVYNWSAQDHLSELDTRSIPQTGTQPETPASPDKTVSSNEQSQEVHSPQQQAFTDDYETWATQQEIDDDLDPSILERQPWFQAASNASSIEDTSSDSPPSEETPSWSAFTPREEEGAPPAWLGMLTKSEKTPPAEALPLQPSQTSAKKPGEEVASPAPAQPAASFPSQSSPLPPVNQTWDQPFGTPDVLPPASAPAQEIEPSFFFSSENHEEDMGWPEWLKTLGAETLEPASQSESTRETFSPEASNPRSEQSEEQRAEEARQLAALEALEQSLYSEGFVPLEPGSLSVISQSEKPAQAEGSVEEADVALPFSQEEPAQPWWATPWLPPTSPAAPTTAPLVSEPVVMPTAQMPVDVPPPTLPEVEQLPAADVSTPAPLSMPVVPGAQPPVPTPTFAPIEQPPVPTPTFVPTGQPVTAVPSQAPVSMPAVPTQESPLLSAYRADALLDNDLETTMKRPAVRLQPVQPGAAGLASLGGKGRAERAGSDTNLSNKERLVRGYQCQLAGAYDDAMQEYRTIIRNAPELLGEVISNMRALLKLAPKYTAGYRVLGDAYMRQGEYLQAMEAYNKALTMAKKAKSQSH